MAYEKVFTAEDYAATMIAMCWSMKATEYKATKPLNCLYYWGNGKWSADCNNLYKCSIWGLGELPKNIGGYWYNPGRYGLGDLTCKQLIESCSDVSSNFSKKVKAELMYISDPNPAWGHIGIHVGDFQKTINGKTYTYNTIESTPIWNNGIQSTYVDEQGRRFQCKGGAQAGVWELHGKAPNINYGDKKTEPLEYTIKSGKDFATIDFDGSGTITVTVKGK